AAGGDIGEGAVVIVAIERRQGAAPARRPVLAVDEQNVGPAVAIGIEKGAPRAHGFRQILLARAAAVVDEVYARLRRHVGEYGSGVGGLGRDQESGKCEGKKNQNVPVWGRLETCGGVGTRPRP